MLKIQKLEVVDVVVVVVHANNKMYTLLKPPLMHVLLFFLFPSMLKK